MSLYTSALSALSGVQKALPGLDRPEDTALGRVKGFLGNVAGTIGAGFNFSPQGDIAYEEDQRSNKLYEDAKSSLEPLSQQLKTQETQQRTQQNQDIASGKYAVKTGPGTFAGNLSAKNVGGANNLPQLDEIQKAPTGRELATAFTKQQMTEELGKMIDNGYMPQRSVAGGIMASAINGLTLGTIGGEDPNNPLTAAQIKAKPISGAEQVGRFGAQMVGGLPTYALLGGAISEGMAKVGPQALRAFAAENPLFWTALVENGARETADMAIRKGTGQEYGPANFMFGMMMGGAVDALRYGPLKNVDSVQVRQQINNTMQELRSSTGRLPSMEEAYTHLKDKIVPGTNMSYSSVLRENRMLYYREKTPPPPEQGGRLPEPVNPKPSSDGEVPVKTPQPENNGKALADEITSSKIQEDVANKSLADKDLELMMAADSAHRSYVENLPEYKKFWEGAKKMLRHTATIRELEHYGPEAKQISKKMLNANYKEVNMKAEDFRSLQTLPDITDQEAQAVGQHLLSRGQKPLQTPAEIAWGNWTKQYMTQAAREQVAQGMTVKDPTTGEVVGQVKPDTYYIPHMVSDENKKLFAGWLRKFGLDPETKSIKINDTVAKKVMEASKGKIKSIDEAMRILRFQQMRPGMRSGHLELARSDMHGIPERFLETDVRKVLKSYIPEYRRRLSWVQEFGAQGKYGEQLDSLLREAAANGRDTGTMKNIVENVTGLSKAAVEKTGAFSPEIQSLSSGLRSLAAGTKLSFLTSLNNIADVSKAAGLTGRVVPTLRNFATGFFGKRVPAAMDMNIRGLTDDLGDNWFAKFAKGSLKVGQFDRSEGGVRNVIHKAAVNDAEIIVKQLNKKLLGGRNMETIKNPSVGKRMFDENLSGVSYRRLSKYLDNPEEAIKRGSLTQAEKDLIGTKSVYETQPISPQDVPYYSNNPIGRIPYQFKTFSIKTASFLNKHIVSELKAGNARPLVAYMTAAEIFGEASADARAAILGKKRNEKVIPRMLENIAQVGGAGLITDVLSSIMYGNYGGGLYAYIGGPSAKNIIDNLNLLREPTLSDAGQKFMQNNANSVPVIGPLVKNYLYPSKNNTYNPGFPIPFTGGGSTKSALPGIPRPPRAPSIPHVSVPRPPRP